ncbi:hypothetical protein [Actinopolymorpha pittospori]
MSRVVVVGVSGSGKTTLSGELSRRLRVPHIELDSIFWQPSWTSLPPERFEARVKDACAGGSWVVDGNYAAAIRELVWTAADTVIWLDLPRPVVMRQLVLRTVRRTSGSSGSARAASYVASSKATAFELQPPAVEVVTFFRSTTKTSEELAGIESLASEP